MFGPVETMAAITTYGNLGGEDFGLTDYSVQQPVIVSPPSDNLDYIANPGPYVAATNSNPFQPVDSDYNNWTVTNGVFNVTTCPGDVCGDPVINEDGMYQRPVIVAGVTYYQTIFVDGAISGNPTVADFTAGSIGFRSETFVKSGAGSGLAGRTHLAEQGGYAPDYTGGYIGTNTVTNDLPTDGGDYVQDVALNTGWANQGSVINPTTGETEPQAAIALTQDLFIPDYNVPGASPVKEHFAMETGENRIDKRIAITSQAATGFGVTYDSFPSPINFYSVTVSGAYQQTASADYGDPFAANGLTWVTGDALQISWVAGEYGVTPTVANAKVNATRIANRTSGTSHAVTDVDTPLLTNDSPAFWYVDPFLDAPAAYPAFP